MDPESMRFMALEIHILRRLDHPNVIRLEGIVTSRLSHNLYLVFEYMDHDLAGLAATPRLRFTEPQVKCFMTRCSPSNLPTGAPQLPLSTAKTEPLVCDPSSLPKHPPSKEYDAKLRGQAMRQNAAAAAMGGKGSISVKPERNEPAKAVPAQDPMAADQQRGQMRNNPKSSSHHYTMLFFLSFFEMSMIRTCYGGSGVPSRLVIWAYIFYLTHKIEQQALLFPCPT